jgi:hypothetical protein
MKHSKLTLLTLALVTLFCACSKDQVKPVPVPGHGHTTSVYRLVVDNLVGISNPQDGLYAIASITNEQNQEILTDKKLPLSYDGKYSSQDLELPSGKYKLTKFVLFDQKNKVQYAAPVTGSEKAQAVSKRLSISFSLGNMNVLNVGVEVLSVLAGELPVSFGYPAGTFNEGTADNNSNLRIRLKTVISNGDVVYDSIPASLRLTTWDERNEWSIRNIELEPGTNEILLPKTAVKFKFQVWQWGHTDEMSLLKKDVDTNTVYIIGGSRAAKKLKSELVYTLVSGSYKADSKNEYSYGTNGKLNRITYYLKRKDGTPYIAFTDAFSYAGGRVENIVKVDENGAAISTTFFQYDAQGKLVSMKQKDNGANEINAAVTYMPATGSQMVQINYTYSHNNIQLFNNLTMTGGNMVKMEAATTNMKSETGLYQYDFSINPHANMGWPDLFFSRQSKNNVIGQQKSYSGNYPTADPYKFEYKYDDYGYPTELIKSFKSPITNQHLFITKTVYNYY